MIKNLEELCQDTVVDIIFNLLPYHNEQLQIRNTDSPSTSKINPFAELPSPIVDKLLKLVLEFANFHNFYIRFSMVHLLVNSGKVTEFYLRNAIKKVSDFLKLSEALAKHGKQLKCLVLEIKLKGKCSCSNKQHTLQESLKEDCSICGKAIENIIEAAPNIRCFVSSIKFDIRQLARLKNLKELKLGFLSDWKTYACSSQRMKKGKDILFILQNCRELTMFENDITTTMHWLNSRMIVESQPLPTFKLNSIFLGPESYHEGFFHMITTANPKAVKLASEVCPMVTELKLYVTDEGPFRLLTNFTSLVLLEVGCMRDRASVNVKAPYLTAELRSMGRNLKTLRMLNFHFVDLVDIAKVCPKLRELALIDCCTTVHSIDSLTQYNCFNELEKVLIDSAQRAGPKDPYRRNNEYAAFLFMIAFLCRSPKLKQLFIYNITLDVHMIRDFAKLKCFSQLTSLYMTRAYYKNEDLANLLSTCRNLKELELGLYHNCDYVRIGRSDTALLADTIRQVKPNLKLTLTKLKELSLRMTSPYHHW